MAEDFVRREVYEADQRRIDERIDRVLERFDAAVRELRQDNDNFKAEIKAQNAEFRENVTRDLGNITARVSNVETKIDALTHAISIASVSVAVFGVVVALIALFK